MISKSKFLIYFINQFYDFLDFIFNLRLCHKDMGIVLCKASYTHQSMKLSGLFVTVHKAKFPKTKWKFFVRTRLHLINKHSTWTVHWFYSKIHVVNYCCVHIFSVMIPVS